MLIMGDITLWIGFQSPPSTAIKNALTKDIAKQMTVRATVMPTAFQKFAPANKSKKSTTTLSGVGNTRGLSLTSATIHHSARTKAKAING